ncbi:MAG: CBS domain-containing protein [Desulfocurvibacter africanus]
MFSAKDIMSTQVITFTPDTEIVAAARVLLEKRINGAPVVEGDRLVGILSQTDLVAQQKTLTMPTLFTLLDGFIPLRSYEKLDEDMRKISAMTVGEAMTVKPVTVRPDTAITDIAQIMVEKKIHTLPVVEGDRLVGVIGKEDVLRTLLDRGGR